MLIAWAKWGQIHHLGYPRKSSMFGERTDKMSLYAPTWAPEDVLEMDQAVGFIEPEERRMLIHRYLWHLSLFELGLRWGISKWSARRKLENAEWAVHAAYCQARNSGISAECVKSSL